MYRSNTNCKRVAITHTFLYHVFNLQHADCMSCNAKKMLHWGSSFSILEFNIMVYQLVILFKGLFFGVSFDVKHLRMLEVVVCSTNDYLVWHRNAQVSFFVITHWRRQCCIDKWPIFTVDWQRFCVLFLSFIFNVFLLPVLWFALAKYFCNDYVAYVVYLEIEKKQQLVCMTLNHNQCGWESGGKRRRDFVCLNFVFIKINYWHNKVYNIDFIYFFLHGWETNCCKTVCLSKTKTFLVDTHEDKSLTFAINFAVLVF